MSRQRSGRFRSIALASALFWAHAVWAVDPPGAAGATRFLDNGNGTITDTKTGLMWEKLSDDDSVHDKDAKYVWSDAPGKIKILNGANFAGYSDWRLPDVNQLAALVSRGVGRPAIEPIFNTGCAEKCTVLTCSCTMPGHYWSTTTYKIDPSIAGALDFRSGFVDSVLRKNNNFVRAVRGGS